jgi:hypothetical protein
MLINRWQSGTALFMALGLTSTAALPLLLSNTAAASEPVIVAQLFPQPSRVAVRAGTVIPVRYDEAEKIIVTPEETSSVTLIVAENIRSTSGTVIIPEGSEIEGELRPAEGGTRFMAERVTLPNRDTSYPIDATSQVITRTETITRNSDPDILQGAAIGAAAGAVLAEIFGDIDFVEVLAGAGVGVLASVLLRGQEEVEVVVVYPETDLDLTLRSDFTLRPSN